MELNLKGKKVLVTGGTKGIGKAIAKAFLAEGAYVAIAARNGDELSDVKRELGLHGTYQNDLSKLKEREQLITAFINDFKTIDVLVNNAGASHGDSVLDTSLSMFDEAMGINFLSVVHLSQLASKNMIENKKGVIINISSIYGKEAGGLPAYNASKSALISFTKSFGTEAIKNNIRVVGIAPGAIYHPNEEWKQRLERDPDYLTNYAREKIPARRLGTPEEIGHTAVFLASDKASWIIGSTITVDGGQSRMNF